MPRAPAHTYCTAAYACSLLTLAGTDVLPLAYAYRIFAHRVRILRIDATLPHSPHHDIYTPRHHTRTPFLRTVPHTHTTAPLDVGRLHTQHTGISPHHRYTHGLHTRTRARRTHACIRAPTPPLVMICAAADRTYHCTPACTRTHTRHRTTTPTTDARTLHTLPPPTRTRRFCHAVTT